jgi:hypothetical protein
LRTVAPLRRGLAARVIDQDPPHHLRGHAKEVGPAFEVDAALLDEPEVRLVNERRGLQRVAVPLTAKLPGGNSTQLGIDHWQQGFEGVAIPATPVSE